MKKFISFPLLFLILVLASLSALLAPDSASAEECGGPVPPAPQGVWAKSGPAPGQVTLYWKETAYANRYAVAYGTMSNTYTSGADNIGGNQSRSYTVKYLTPGAKYYFRLAAAQGCASSPFSGEITGVAMSGQGVMPPSIGAPVMKQRAAGPVGKQMLWSKSGPNVGEVTLYWTNNENADDYHLIYGTNMQKPEYGALNIGKLHSFTVGKLTPGAKYYFALVPVMNNMAMYTTPFVSGWSRALVQVVQTSREALIQPVVSPVKIQKSMVSPSPVVTDTGTSSGTIESTPTTSVGQ